MKQGAWGALLAAVAVVAGVVAWWMHQPPPPAPAPPLLEGEPVFSPGPVETPQPGARGSAATSPDDSPRVPAPRPRRSGPAPASPKLTAQSAFIGRLSPTGKLL